MNFLNKKIASLDVLLICCALLLFLARLYACQFMLPEFTGMDYYGYIELGKNIFHKLDFSVRWELGSPLEYPPLFSILIYLLTILTKNFITSIQFISILSASFYIIPLFSLVKNILNTYYAVLAVVFSTYYFGLKPCVELKSDFFFSFLVIIICWLLWDTLFHRRLQAGRYVLTGILISLAFLTKYSGAMLCYAGMISVLYYFLRLQRDIKTGFRMSSFILLGFAPLFVSYHLLLFNDPKAEIPSISAYTFFDGNYLYQGGLTYRNEKVSELDPGGTEFRYLSFLKSNNVLKFSLENPGFIFDKYKWGLEKNAEDLTFSVIPDGAFKKSRFFNIGPDGGRVLSPLIRNGVLLEVFPTEVMVNPNSDLTMEAVRKAAGVYFVKVWGILQESLVSREITSIIVQGAFLFLLMISGSYYKWHPKIMHILFFCAAMVFIPFFHCSGRYLMPFMVLYFILWLFIVDTGHSIIKLLIKDGGFSRYLALAFFAFIVSIYIFSCGKKIYQDQRYMGDRVRQNERWLKAATWIKIDSMTLHRRAKIMSLDNYVPYLTDADYIRLPSVISDREKVLDFAALKGVDYIVVEGQSSGPFLALDPGANALPRHVKITHEIMVDDKTVLILKISSAGAS